MTQPPVDPAGPPTADSTPTEPAMVPASPPDGDGGSPATAPAPGAPAAAPAGSPATASAPGGRDPRRRRLLASVLGAAVLLGAVGVAFAAGRASAPGDGDAGRPWGRADGAPGWNRDGAFNPEGGRDRGSPGGRYGGPAGPGMSGPGMSGPSGRGRGLPGSGRMGLSGTVAAVTDEAITLELANGARVTVGTDDGTTYHQQAPAARGDVAVGDTVQVRLVDGLRPRRAGDGDIDLGTAGDVTIVP